MNKKGREVGDRDVIAEAASNLAEGGWSSFYSVMEELHELDPQNRYFTEYVTNEEDICDECEDNVGFDNLSILPKTRPEEGDHFVCKDCLKELSE